MMDIEPNLKIGLIGPLPPPYGGMANQAKQLYELLNSENIEVKYVQNNSDYQPKFIGKIKGLRAIFRLIPFLVRTWNLAGTVDIIHVLSNSGWAWQFFSAPVLWISWIRNTPVIINYRGGEANTYFTKSIAKVRPSLDKAAKIIVPSGYLKEIFSDFNYEVEIIPNIINLERFKEKSGEAPGFHLMVARNLEPIYGIDTAIKAVAILKNNYPQIKLSIAGDGPQKKQLIELVHTLELNENVSFTGKLTPDQMVNLFHNSDIMLNPSTVDNMPNAILESMACAVPVVTTNAGGIPYVVTDSETALIVDINMPEQMADAVTKLFKDTTLYHKIAKNGVQEVKKYTWDEVKPQWLELYQQLKIKQ